MIIAIDGPAGSGKSSTARALAQALGGVYLDTGAMYRAMALAFRRDGIPVTEHDAEAAVDDVRIDLVQEAGETLVLLNGLDVSAEIRSPDVTRAASLVSQLPSVRGRLVAEQRRLADSLSDDGRAVVVEGRDIGTVVFPHADVKFFMVADPVTRAERRLMDLRSVGQSAEFDDVLHDIKQRDRQDEEREHSPLRQADDAVKIDTTEMTPSEQLTHMLNVVATRRPRRST